MPKRTLQKLNMYHGDDDDLDDDYDDFYEQYEDDDLRRSDEENRIYQGEANEITELNFSFNDSLKEEIFSTGMTIGCSRMNAAPPKNLSKRLTKLQPALQTEEDIRDHIARLFRLAARR